MNFSKLTFGSLVTLILITGCATSGNTSNDRKLVDMTLKSHLNRERHITFNGNSVFVTGATMGAFQGNKLQPVFIINGIDAGRGFVNAKNIISNRKIESVDVYRASEAGRWGGRGGYGVVVVKTRSDSSS